MRNQFLFLSTLLAAVTALAAGALAQETQADAITDINGESLNTDASPRFFNADNCADPASTTYSVTLTNGDGVTKAYMWAGAQNAGCEDLNNRDLTKELCRPMASSVPRTVGDNATVTGLTLQELVDTGVVNCENTTLEGQPYEIYSFRGEDPGGTVLVPPEGYGVAPFTVDVTPPDELSIESASEQTGSTFTISWDAPLDSNSIAQYKLYEGTSEDPATAVFTDITAGQNEKDISVSAAQLNLDPIAGDSTYLFVSAVDMAAVTIGNGNEGPLSVVTTVTAAETSGFCSDPNIDCSGCSVSPMMLANGQPGSGPWVVGLLLAIFCVRRLRG
jgi:hypothetical protein